MDKVEAAFEAHWEPRRKFIPAPMDVEIRVIALAAYRAATERARRIALEARSAAAVDDPSWVGCRNCIAAEIGP